MTQKETGMQKTEQIKTHPAADIFPMLPAADLARLADDIKAQGLQHPLVMHKGLLLDGRNRLAACKITDVKPSFTEYEGDSPLGFVISVNIKRRQLNPSQRACVGVEIEPMFSVEAKKRALIGNAAGGRNSKSVADLPPTVKAKARDQAADVCGVSPRMVQYAKEIKAADQRAFDRVKSGDVTINKAYSELRKATKKTKREKEKKKVEEATGVKAGERCRLGDLWILGDHVLFCGDTSTKEFLNVVDKHAGGKAALAFADPPYGANVVGYDDSEFYWEHDYLAVLADVVIVTPGIVSIFELARRTEMEYRWSLAAWITNGMTRGALGFGNWIYAAVFSSGSVFRQAQDFSKVTISNAQAEDTDHPTRKPTEYVQWIVETFTKQKQLVLDPFLGSGQTLIVCEASGRRCIGGEIDTKFCSEIVSRWEFISGKKAVKA